MASSAISLLVTCTCVLLFAGRHHAAVGEGPGLARVDELLHREASAEETSSFRRTGVKGASPGPVMARRVLAARLGGATKGSSPSKGTGKGAVHPSDAAVLLKAAAKWKKDPDTWDVRKLLATWDVKRPCSQWFGVTCNSATHRVAAIKLAGFWDPNAEPSKDPPLFQLGGSFPADWGSLPELRSLILARNRLSNIPKAWTRLRKLSHLDLSDNWELTGSLDPGSVGVPLALCNLTSLTYLNMAGTDITYLPQQFKSLKKLSWLDLSIEVSSGDIKTLSSLPRLTALVLRSTPKLPVISGLSQLHGLKLLDLSSFNIFPASFWKTFPAWLKGLTALDDLSLRDMTDINSNGVPIPTWLGRLRQLTSLDLSLNFFTGSLPSQLGALSNLAKLNLFGNSLTGKVPQALLNSRSLFHINLSGNKLDLAGITFGPHASSRLKRLDLSLNSLKGTIPKGLSSLTRLETLSLSSNDLSGALPPFLWTIPTLSKLDLSFNSLTGLGPSSQQVKAGRLKNLRLDNNNFQGSIPKGLSALKSLTALSLNKNQFKGSIPSWLGALRGLVSLDLSDNKLTGSIPQGLGAGKQLAYLSLGSNQLTGSIPGSLFRANLKLNVGNNRLSGNLPARALDLWMRYFLHAMTSEEHLLGPHVDVSGNFLTGPCPRASRSWTHNGSLTGCSYVCQESIDTERGGLVYNCLQGCEVPWWDTTEDSYDPAPQRSNAECARFCRADKRNGPCNGHGSCSLKGPKKTPTCTCSKGYVAPASKPGTCVPAPK